MGKRAVVLGGAGFIGTHLVERLLAEGVQVVCVDNFITSERRAISRLLADPQLELITADASERVRVTGPVDYVINLASPASPADYLAFPIETLTVGSVGTMNALELARDKGARFLLASTSEVYGDAKVHPQPETYWGNVNPVGPRGVYDEAKRFAEAMTVAYRRRHGVNTAIMRIFNTYGPGMRPADGRVVPTLMRQALMGEPLTVTGDGSQTRSFCYVDDLVEGALRLLLHHVAGPLNLGNPSERTILELARSVIAATGSSSGIVFRERPEDEPTVRQPDISRARRILGWEPRVDHLEGMRRTAQWFRAELQGAAHAGTVGAGVE